MLKIFLISLFASAAFALSDKCDIGREICTPEEGFNKMVTMPETAEELDAFCGYALNYFECLLEVQSECENGTIDEHSKGHIQVLKHLCNKETDLYKSLLLVLPCLKHEIAEKKTRKCYAMFQDEPTLQKFETILNHAGINDVTKDHDCFGNRPLDTSLIRTPSGLPATFCSMLKLFLIVLFGSVASWEREELSESSSGTSWEECIEKARETCKAQKVPEPSIEMPETVEELDAYCVYQTNYQAYMDKLANDYGDSDYAEPLSQRIPVTERICNKDAELYHDLVIVLPCIKEMIKKIDNQCSAFYSNEEFLKKFENILFSAGITDVCPAHSCFREYFADACKIGGNGAECGLLARKVLREIKEMYSEGKRDKCSVTMQGKLSEVSLAMEVLYIEATPGLEL